MGNTLLKILKETFGFSSFRGDQEKVIETLVDGGSALLLMPTGAGKSLCFQLPAKILGGPILVLSPLKALMKDQVDQVPKGLRATYINSSLTRGERQDRIQGLKAGLWDLVYVTPERFRSPEFREALQTLRVPLLAIDEAHCISQWGHDFRPDYSRLGEIREFLGRPPTLAVTATATPSVQADILKQLGLDAATTPVFQGGLERPNLTFEVLDLHGADQKIQAFMALRHQNPGPTIVYFSLIDSLHSFAHEIRRLGVPFSMYHGNLPEGSKRAAQEAFLEGRSSLILATPAFGLGINKPDVRLVLHAELPGSLESYFQEAGRAGRDGKTSQAVLLFDEEDVSIQADFVKWSNPDPGFVQSVYNLIQRNPDRWRAEGTHYLRKQLNFFNTRDFRSETAVGLLERWGFLREEKGLLVAAEDPKGELVDQEHWKTRLRLQNERLLAMVQYSKTNDCRAQWIYRYFGNQTATPCGRCDNCLGKK